MLTMRPLPRSSINGSTAWQHHSVVHRFRFIVSRRVSAVCSRNGRMTPPPALLTNTSIAPKRCCSSYRPYRRTTYRLINGKVADAASDRFATELVHSSHFDVAARTTSATMSFIPSALKAPRHATPSDAAAGASDDANLAAERVLRHGSSPR